MVQIQHSHILPVCRILDLDLQVLKGLELEVFNRKPVVA